MNERIARVRKYSALSMEQFGSRIGLTKSMVSRMESGKNDPTDRTIQSICREFNVNEEWLRTGNGEMLQQDNDSILDRIAQKHDLTAQEQAVVAAFLELSTDDRAAIMRYVNSLVEKLAATEPDHQAKARPSTNEMTAEELHAALDRELQDEKEQQARLQVFRESGFSSAKLA